MIILYNKNIYSLYKNIHARESNGVNQIMNQRSWKDKKDEICKIIKQISDHYGGDDIHELREYCKEIIQNNINDFDGLLKCVQDLQNQLKFMPKIIKVNQIKNGWK